MNSEQAGIIEGNESQAMAASKAGAGLYRKYDVRRVRHEIDQRGERVEVLVPVTDECFVLQASDPYAPIALIRYAEGCAQTYPQLSTELREMADRWAQRLRT